MNDEVRNLEQRYIKRDLVNTEGQWSPLAPYTMYLRQERQRAIMTYLRHYVQGEVGGLYCTEVGCGTGDNLVEFISLGFSPERLTGIELLPSRAAIASHRVPASVNLHVGDALGCVIADESQDLVYQSLVFTSILDADYQKDLADRMWRWLKPGGAVLWYDFIYNNPHNPDVRGVPMPRVRELFPRGHITVRRITLAPPIGRLFSGHGLSAYMLLNLTPLLRTHLLCWIKK